MNSWEEIKMVTKEDCEREGKIFVGSHRLRDGTLVHSYCKERELPMRHDRNGNSKLKWKRHSDPYETEYIVNGNGKEGVVKARDGYSVWWVEHNGKRVDGKTTTVREAKSEVERRMRD